MPSAVRCAWVCAVLWGCGTPPLGVPRATARLRIENPQRLDVHVDAVAGDRRVPVAHPGSSEVVDLTLFAGAYVVYAATARGDVALAAPLLAEAAVGATPLRVRIEAPPARARDDAEFAWIPAGPALIGDALGVGQEDERPARIRDVAAFWLGRCEVTNAQYVEFLTAVDPDVDPAWCAFDSRKCRLQRDATTGQWSTSAPREPVVTVSLAGALAYCRFRSRATGVPHRLPTEIEWEKAARGPESFVFSYGNVYRRDAANQESGTLREAASGKASGFGLFDMTGNAFEWTGDAYGTPGRRAMIPDQVLRGGSFVLDGMYLRSSFRMRQRPEVRTDDFGFRVVREAVPADLEPHR